MRERAFGLLSELCGDGEFPVDALRTASHTLFDVARHAGPETLYAVSEALPWMAAFVSLSSGDITQQEASTELFARGALRALPPSAVTRRLREAVQATLRSPAKSVDGPVAQALRESALLDKRLASLLFRADDDLRAHILGDAELLAAAMELCEEDEGASTEARERLSQLFPRWTRPDVRPRSRSLRVLEGLETSWDGGLVARVAGLSERSLRFELSAVDHLRQNDILEAVRAALAFAAVEPEFGLRDELEDERAFGSVEPGVLRQFPIFRDDAPLEALALALIEMRGRTIAFVRGSMPFSMLSPWVDFLRGPCAEYAESRDITLREATSFAHFAFHLMNFCDLVAFHRGAANDSVRRALMDVEDELKEFALAYQREGLTDGASDLARFEDARWRSSGALVRLSDRLARLRGGWREGTDSTAMGAPPRVSESQLQHHQAILSTLEEDAPFTDALSNLLAEATVLGVRWLETLNADEIVGLLTRAAITARDSESVDTSSPWVLDVRPLARWATSEAPLLRAEVLDQLMGRICPGGLLTQPRQTGASMGLTARTSSDDTVELAFEPHPELEALLTLLGKAEAGTALSTVLNARLEELLEPALAEQDPTQELVLSADARDELGL